MIIFDLKIIGEKLRKIRIEKRLSQDEAAWQAGISSRTYADIERGAVNARIESILKICDFFEINPDMILTEKSSHDLITDEDILIELNSLSLKNKRTAVDILKAYIKNVKGNQ
ncbi:MAG: helix-turn-helix domain-containing protein [Lachnospiraceae bacterium]|nr:helix-turn-helix domain-containing protein [Lachnospiraceae bacterium]